MRYYPAFHPVGYPSGQRGQTVNLLAVLSYVRIVDPPPSSRTRPMQTPWAGSSFPTSSHPFRQESRAWTRTRTRSYFHLNPGSPRQQASSLTGPSTASSSDSPCRSPSRPCSWRLWRSAMPPCSGASTRTPWRPSPSPPKSSSSRTWGCSPSPPQYPCSPPSTGARATAKASDASSASASAPWAASPSPLPPSVCSAPAPSCAFSRKTVPLSTSAPDTSASRVSLT